MTMKCGWSLRSHVSTVRAEQSVRNNTMKYVSIIELTWIPNKLSNRYFSAYLQSDEKQNSRAWFSIKCRSVHSVLRFNNGVHCKAMHKFTDSVNLTLLSVKVEVGWDWIFWVCVLLDWILYKLPIDSSLLSSLKWFYNIQPFFMFFFFFALAFSDIRDWCSIDQWESITAKTE